MKNKYLIRFNTKNNGSPLVWRVFENGVEFLASDICINIPCFSETSKEGDQTKWNLACEGFLSWEGTKAVITSSPKS